MSTIPDRKLYCLCSTYFYVATIRLLVVKDMSLGVIVFELRVI